LSQQEEEEEDKTFVFVSSFCHSTRKSHKTLSPTKLWSLTIS
jgi:hypothetical protein